MRYIKREWDTSVVIACECGCGVEEPVFIPEPSVTEANRSRSLACVLKERNEGIPRLEQLEMLVSALVKDAQYFGSAISRIDATLNQVEARFFQEDEDGLVIKDSENIIHTIPRNVMKKIRKLDMAVGRINTYLQWYDLEEVGRLERLAKQRLDLISDLETELEEKSDDE